MVNIKNKKVLQQLEQYGDDLKQSRQVLHWAYFKNQEDRHAFIREAEQLGYQLDEAQLDLAFVEVKKLADRKKEVHDADLEGAVTKLFRSSSEGSEARL